MIISPQRQDTKETKEDNDGTIKEEGNTIINGTIREWPMAAKMKNNTYLFHSVIPGRKGKCYFLHKREQQEETENWLDLYFNCTMQ